MFATIVYSMWLIQPWCNVSLTFLFFLFSDHITRWLSWLFVKWVIFFIPFYRVSKIRVCKVKQLIYVIHQAFTLLHFQPWLRDFFGCLHFFFSFYYFSFDKILLFGWLGNCFVIKDNFLSLLCESRLLDNTQKFHI